MKITLTLIITILLSLSLTCCKNTPDTPPDTNPDNAISSHIPPKSTPTALSTENEPLQKNARLVINGKEIDVPFVYIHSDKKYAELPIIAICNALGADIEGDANELTVTYNDEPYHIGLTEFYDPNEATPAPGGHPIIRIVSDDYIFSDGTLDYFFLYYNLECRVSYSDMTVYINSTASM